MESKTESIELCLAELQEVCEHIQQLQRKYKTLVQQRNHLRQKAKEMMSAAPAGYTSRRMERDYELIRYVTDLLKKHQQPLSLQDICDALQDIDADFIPFQIISLKTYVNRRLTNACEEGQLELIQHDQVNGKYYALPSLHAYKASRIKQLKQV